MDNRIITEHTLMWLRGKAQNSVTDKNKAQLRGVGLCRTYIVRNITSVEVKYPRSVGTGYAGYSVALGGFSSALRRLPLP